VKSQSTQQLEEEEDFIQETPEAALVAAQAYLLTTQPEPGDQREHMHQAVIQSLRLVLTMHISHSRSQDPKERSQCKAALKYPTLVTKNLTGWRKLLA
jgi:hypothetical protein